MSNIFQPPLFVIHKHENITIPFNVGDTKNQYNFPDLPNLRDVHLERLECWYASKDIGNFEPMKVTPDGTLLVEIDILKYCFVTLENYAGVQFLKDCPIKEFTNFAVQGIFEPQTKFSGQKVNWPKSFISFSPSLMPVPPAASFEWMFSVFYAEKTKQSQKESSKTFGNKG